MYIAASLLYRMCARLCLFASDHVLWEGINACNCLYLNDGHLNWPSISKYLYFIHFNHFTLVLLGTSCRKFCGLGHKIKSSPHRSQCRMSLCIELEYSVEESWWSDRKTFTDIYIVWIFIFCGELVVSVFNVSRYCFSLF